MYVIGTAGHVDHGKSTLVKALTGIDPDRLAEEKERGLTIDLGFAWLRFPGGKEVSMVDVPGHERFVNNMLAGVGSIDMVLLVVAADESVMPQTREHLAILDILGVDLGIVAITKCDLVETELAELVSAEVEEVLADTILEDSPSFPVSGVTGEGLPELIVAIEDMLVEVGSKKDFGRPRLAIDRSFTLSGFGTVVTGTLVDGSLDVGQEVELVPLGKTARIRGLETHNRKIEHAEPGTRVAANLSGLGHNEISRGDVLTVPGWLAPTDAIDVRLNVLPDATGSVRHNMFTTVHTGSNETLGRVRLLEGDSIGPGESTWAQLKLDRPISVVKGDRFVVRTNQLTVGGGTIIEANARRHRRNYEPVLERLTVMEAGSDRDVLTSIVESVQPVRFLDLVNRSNLHHKTVRSELETMVLEKTIVILGGKTIDATTLLFTSGGWLELSSKATGFLEKFHGQYPLRKGVSKEELRNRLKLPLQIFNEALSILENEGILVEEGPIIRRPQHVRRIPKSKRDEVNKYLDGLEKNPFSPPTDSSLDPDLLSMLVEAGKVVRVSENVVFASDAYQEMESVVASLILERGEITVGDVRDSFGTSRKYAVAVLDYLDQKRITRRVGDVRVLR